MNLTIPIIYGQTATINIIDNKTKEMFTWIADHSRVSCIRSHDGKSVTCFRYEAVVDNENISVKGVGRAKRRCPKSLKIKTKGEG
jgi:hypothetical protein